ncbi:hypothetical protein PT974_03685 [Cladobotryum mycophilum]|uniref:Uncharacterized protein n=1 Tax=Cladobotryum mycophilum TaxID=491253 RepID=A0ABR0STD1_9HYPO
MPPWFRETPGRRLSPYPAPTNYPTHLRRNRTLSGNRQPNTLDSNLGCLVNLENPRTADTVGLDYLLTGIAGPLVLNTLPSLDTTELVRNYSDDSESQYDTSQYPEHQITELFLNTPGAGSYVDSAQHHPRPLFGLPSGDGFGLNNDNTHLPQIQPILQEPSGSFQHLIIAPDNGYQNITSQIGEPPHHMSNVQRSMVDELHMSYQKSGGNGFMSHNPTPETSNQGSQPPADAATGSNEGEDDSGVELVVDDSREYFKCPYAAQNPLLLEKSCWAKLSSIAYLKAHLRTFHTPPTCDERRKKSNPERSEPKATRVHNRSANNTSSAVLSIEQHDDIIEREDRRAGHEGQWKRIYGIIFPDDSAVPSPYLNLDAMDWMRKLIMFSEGEGVRILEQKHAGESSLQFKIVLRIWVREVLSRHAPQEVLNCIFFSNLTEDCYDSPLTNTTVAELGAQSSPRLWESANSTLPHMQQQPLNFTSQFHQSFWDDSQAFMANNLPQSFPQHFPQGLPQILPQIIDHHDMMYCPNPARNDDLASLVDSAFTSSQGMYNASQPSMANNLAQNHAQTIRHQDIPYYPASMRNEVLPSSMNTVFPQNESAYNTGQAFMADTFAQTVAHQHTLRGPNFAINEDPLSSMNAAFSQSQQTEHQELNAMDMLESMTLEEGEERFWHN